MLKNLPNSFVISPALFLKSKPSWIILKTTMKKQSALMLILKFLGLVIICELVLFAIVAAIGWRYEWSSLDQYTEALQIAGMLAIGLGLFGIKGNWEATRGFEYQYSMSASEQSSLQRTQQVLADIAEGYRFMLLMFCVGGLSILIGWVL